MLSPGRRYIYAVVSLALAGALLYFALRGIEWGARSGRWWRRPRRVAGRGAGDDVPGDRIRSVRWRVLLSAGAGVSYKLAFWATAAGYFGNSVLPARAGELIRTLIISRTSGMSTIFVLTTALAERVSTDAGITTAAIILLALPVKPGWFAGVAQPFAMAGLCGVAGIALIPVYEMFWLRLLKRLPIPSKLRDGIATTLGQVLQAMRTSTTWAGSAGLLRSR